MLDQVGPDLPLDVDPLAVLGRDDDALELDRPLVAVLVDLVADRHLRLAIGPEVGQDTRLAHLGEAARDRVRERHRQRHQLRRLVARVADHEPLVAGTDAVERVVVARVLLHLERRVNPAGDIGRLLVERDDHGAGLGVEPVLRPRVADRRDPLAHQPRDVDVGARRDLARDDDEAGRHERLARDATDRVVGQHRVEHRVGDLVGDLVGVTLGDRLGRDGEGPRRRSLNPSVLGALVPPGLTRRSARAPSARPQARRAGGPRAPSRRFR